MPYKNELARGDSLARIADSQSVRDFLGIIKVTSENSSHALPARLTPERNQESITKILAIDGSTVTKRVKNGYPGAEAALFNLAAIIIYLNRLREIPENYIPGPDEIRRIEDCKTLSAVLPGCNVVRKDELNETSKQFFRNTLYEELSKAKLDSEHESLLETLRAMTASRGHFTIKCPLVDDCQNKSNDYRTEIANYISNCQCPKNAILFETDSLRIQERFEENGSSEEAYSAFRQVVEHLTLLNILRYCEKNQLFDFLSNTAFIIDGPLAIFGMPAWIKPYIQEEIARIHNLCLGKGYPGLLVIGIEKTGQFLSHLNELDWKESEGHRSKIENGTAFAPDIDYVHKHIVLRPPGFKPYGIDVYYGRKIMYKTQTGQHCVIMTPIVNSDGDDPSCVDLEAFPRIGEALDIMDELGMHLYKDSFTPLVRANAHAAIPLKGGHRILSELFKE